MRNNNQTRNFDFEQQKIDFNTLFHHWIDDSKMEKDIEMLTNNQEWVFQ